MQRIWEKCRERESGGEGGGRPINRRKKIERKEEKNQENGNGSREGSNGAAIATAGRPLGEATVLRQHLEEPGAAVVKAGDGRSWLPQLAAAMTASFQQAASGVAAAIVVMASTGGNVVVVR